MRQFESQSHWISECESQSDSGRGGQKNYELVNFKHLPDF